MKPVLFALTLFSLFGLPTFAQTPGVSAEVMRYQSNLASDFAYAAADGTLVIGQGSWRTLETPSAAFRFLVGKPRELVAIAARPAAAPSFAYQAEGTLVDFNASFTMPNGTTVPAKRMEFINGGSFYFGFPYSAEGQSQLAYVVTKSGKRIELKSTQIQPHGDARIQDKISYASNVETALAGNAPKWTAEEVGVAETVKDMKAGEVHDLITRAKEYLREAAKETGKQTKEFR